jgi:phosphate uptake regulator
MAMTNEQIERAIEFLLNNQAGHDARLGRLEEIVERLSKQPEALQNTQANLQMNVETMRLTVETMRTDLYQGLQDMNEGIQRLTELAERTMNSVQQVFELGLRTQRQVNDLERRVEVLEDKS